MLTDGGKGSTSEGSMALTLTVGCGLTEAMFEFASSLGTVGLSIGVTGPDTNSATLIVEMIGMFLGRLEIYIVLTGIYFSVQRVKLAWAKFKPAQWSAGLVILKYIRVRSSARQMSVFKLDGESLYVQSSSAKLLMKD